MQASGPPRVTARGWPARSLPQSPAWRPRLSDSPHRLTACERVRDQDKTWHRTRAWMAQRTRGKRSEVPPQPLPPSPTPAPPQAGGGAVRASVSFSYTSFTSQLSVFLIFLQEICSFCNKCRAKNQQMGPLIMPEPATPGSISSAQKCHSCHFQALGPLSPGPQPTLAQMQVTSSLRHL